MAFANLSGCKVLAKARSVRFRVEERRRIVVSHLEHKTAVAMEGWMTGRRALIVAIALLTSASAYAQTTGVDPSGAGAGSGGFGGGGRHGGGRGNAQPSGPSSGPVAAKTNVITADKPASKIEIVGVIKEIDRASGRITIAYDPVDELNWPRGVMPFPVAEDSVLTGATVGEKVRFKLDSHEIYEMRPY